MIYNNDDMVAMNDRGMSYDEIAAETGLTHEAVRGRIKRTRRSDGLTAPRPTLQQPPPRLQQSPYPQYDKPLSREGDCLLLFDTEFPFHDSDFINRVFDLAQAWNIRQCIIGGDVLHFDTFSRWGASFISDNKASGAAVPSEKIDEMRKAIEGLPAELRPGLIAKLEAITEPVESDEIGQARRCLDVITQLFDGVDFVLGNHDERFIRLLNTP
jgi:hypothetical protein